MAKLVDDVSNLHRKTITGEELEKAVFVPGPEGRGGSCSP